MPTVDLATLERRRKELLAELRKLPDLMRGTVCERHVRCGRDGCWCTAKGSRGHPGFHLTVNLGGRTRTRFVREAEVEDVRELVSNYRKLWKVVEGLTRVHLDMFRARRKGGRR